MTFRTSVTKKSVDRADVFRSLVTDPSANKRSLFNNNLLELYLTIDEVYY